MTRKDNRPEQDVELRRQAEEIAKKKAARIPENLEALSPEEVLQTLHELRVHQIELEMQNEELRRAQAELEASRVRYFDLYDLAPVGYCTLSEKGLILEANLTVATLLGVARGALVKQLLTRFILKEDQAIYYRHRKQLFETGEPQACELRMVKKDGTTCWTHLEAIAARETGGAPVCRLVMSDITERKRAQVALQQAHDELGQLVADRTEGLMRVNEELRKEIAEHKQAEATLHDAEVRYRLLFEHSPDGIVIIDPATTRPLEFNDTAHLQLGYSRDEFARLSISDIDASETPDETRSQIQKVIRKGRSDFETLHRTRQGEIRNIHVTAQNTEILGRSFYHCIWRDITERKREEVALKESKTLIDSVVEKVPLMIFLKEAKNLRFVIFNRAGEELLGYDRRSLLGKNNLDLFPPEQAAHFMAKDREVLDGEAGMLDIPEEPIHTAKKGQRLLHTRKVCIKGADGVTKYLLGISEDITERKQAEKKIQASLLEKETMLNEIHHRVKNNLQIISSLLNTQSSCLPDEKAREALQESMARVRAMAMIHTQLYESQDLNRVDFGLFIRDLIGNISESYRRAEHPVEIHVDADGISLGIDTSIPCGLILNELVSNALKHAFPEGKEGEIHIRMGLEDSRVALTVQDNGIGFPESIDVTKVKSMGLRLVNILVRQMNGKIDMQVDSGTTWTITFSIKNEREW